MNVKKNFKTNRFIYYFVALMAITAFTAGCQSGSNSANYSPKIKKYTKIDPLSSQPDRQNQKQVNNVLQNAYSQAGKPYRYGGNTPETGFDCSGFVRWVYNQAGVSLPRSSRDMLKHGTPVAINDLQPGDLIFFNYGYSHVGIYTGHGTYIHSPRTGKRIQESPLYSKGRIDRVVGARRLLDNNGVIAPDLETKNAWLAKAEDLHGTMPMAASKKSRNSSSRSKANKSGKSTAKAAQSTKKTTQTAKASKSKNTSAKKGSGSKVHSVSQGDTLYVLAKKHGVSENELKKANNINGKKNLIKPGQKLVIPGKSAAKSNKKAKGA